MSVSTQGFSSPPSSEEELTEEPVLAEEITPETKELLERNASETESMVIAHSSLLLPSIADPDSKENKEILRQMMFKALASPEEPVANNSK